MKILCQPSHLQGNIAAIPSKSHAHRLLICAALADGPTYVTMPRRQGEDIAATLRCLRALGASFEEQGDHVKVTPIFTPPTNPLLDCGESGSTLRFLLPVVAALGCGGTFTGSGRLPQRPSGPLLDALREGGVAVDSDTLPLGLEGKLSPGEYHLPGDVSSQFVTGLLLALPLLGGGGRIKLHHPLESAGYMEITRRALAQFSITVESAKEGFSVLPGQYYRSPGTVMVEGDWSNMAFFLAAGAWGGPVSCTGLSFPSPQGDCAMVDILRLFGARPVVTDGKVTVAAGPPSGGLDIDVRAIPDLVPILAVVAATVPGTTRFTGAARLRLKESDRLASVTHMLQAIGGTVTEKPAALWIKGGNPLRGGAIKSWGDHRIVMAGAIAATVCRGETILDGVEAVNKSYPTFFADYRALGGKYHVLNNDR